MTARSDVRVRMRVVENPDPGPDPGQAGEESAHARAIPRNWAQRQARRAHKATSLHVVEAGEAAAAGWPLTESPPPAGDMWREVLPAKGEAPNGVAWLVMAAAGLFRALVVTACWLVALSVTTRIRAAVGLTLLALITTIGLLARALTQ